LSGKTVTVPGLGSFSPGALIKMIKSDANTRVLSSPHIMTADNEEAKIKVGEKIFFKVQDANATSGTITTKFDKEDADYVLAIKPNISNSNYVTMKVDIEASTATIDPNSGSPNKKTRTTSQHLTVKSGQTVVISGLVQTRDEETFQKIPLLGDIPILGWLFRNSDVQHKTSNLMIFLTPHVVHGADDLAAIYESKIKERDEYLEYAYGSSYKDDRFYSHMPKLEDGKYVSDPLDEDERRRREEIRASYLKEDQPSSPMSDEKKSQLTAPTPVPMNATLGGSGGGDTGSSLAPLPPPVNLPPPAMDGGDFVPPEPPPMIDEPPPPPVVD